MVIPIVVVALTLFAVFHSMVRSIRKQRDPRRTLWREFGLSILFAALFILSWVGQFVTEWQIFTDDARAHGESPAIGDFAAAFGQSTLENWQSEFLQLFSFVALAALYIHKGSAESKDGEETIQASLRRIEEQLGTLPNSAPSDPARRWELPPTPLEVDDEQRRRSEA